MPRKPGDPRSCEDCASHCTSIFAEMRKEQVQGFDQIRKPLAFSAGELLPGKLGSRAGFYCIQEGHVRLSYVNKQSTSVVRICGPGDIIGYGFWHFGSQPTAITLEPCKACFFDKELFLMIQNRSPMVAQAVIKLLCQSIELLDKRISYLENYSVKNRVAATLLSLERKFGKPSEFGSKIDFRLDRKTLAQLSGTVVESLSRTLTELESSKAIARTGRFIHVLDHRKLEKIASG